MKLIYPFAIILLLFSCNDDISNERYRNENYVFYQEDGKDGDWLKINPDLEIKLPKSHSTYFFPNGNRYAEVKVIDSFPNRIVKHYNKENKLTYTNTYKLDSLVKKIYENGYHYGYHSNFGLLQSEGLIENQLMQGKWRFYRKDGETIKQIAEYLNDTLHGIREDYWKDGRLKSKTVNINGKKNGKTYHYYQDGQLEEINFLKNDSVHGKSIRYHPNGNLQAECSYWNGIKKDTCKFYYENGSLKGIEVTEIDTVSTNYTSTIINYHTNGKIKQTFKKINDKANGIVNTYFENGNLSHLFYVKNGIKQGKGSQYHENGIIKYEGLFKDNTSEGNVKEFDNEGKLFQTLKVKNGVVIDTIIH